MGTADPSVAGTPAPATPPDSGAAAVGTGRPQVDVLRWGWRSVAVNVTLASIHGGVAVASGSRAVGAELVHNLLDLCSAGLVLLGLHVASRRSRSYPYGLHKVEDLVAAGLSLLVLVTGWEILRGAAFDEGRPVESRVWMFPVLVVTLAIPLAFSRFELRAARESNSPSLRADALEFRVHALTTGLAILALAADSTGVRIDRPAAAVIAFVVLVQGWSLLRDAMRSLLDASLDRDTLQRVEEAIRGDPAVSHVQWVTGRNAGRCRFVEAGVVLRVPDVGRALAVRARIEAAVRDRVPHVERVLLRAEAPEAEHRTIAVPLGDRSGTVSDHFGEAPWFALAQVRRGDGALVRHEVVANPHRAAGRGRGIRVAAWLVERGADAVLLREDLSGRGPAYVLGEAGVEVGPAPAATFADLFPRPAE